MHMTMQGKKRLTLLDEPSHGDAADMHIERNVFVHFAIESGTVECSIVWRSMEEKFGTVERIVASQCCQLLLNCSPLECILVSRHGSEPFLGRD